MTPADAANAADGTRVFVTGFLVGRGDGPLLLCAELAESDPPQCAGAAVMVTGLGTDHLPGVQRRPDGAVWSDAPVTVRGTMRGGVLSADDGMN